MRDSNEEETLPLKKRKSANEGVNPYTIKKKARIVEESNEELRERGIVWKPSSFR